MRARALIVGVLAGCELAPVSGLEFDAESGDAEPQAPPAAAAPLGAIDSRVRLVARLPLQDAAAGLAFVDLGAAGAHVRALASLHPVRGEVDLSALVDGAWSTVGSFFAGGAPIELRPITLGDHHTIVVRSDADELFLLPVDDADPLRLVAWVELARIRDGFAGFAAVDVDGDAKGELVVASADGLQLLDEAERGIDADPEQPPRLPSTTLLDAPLAELVVHTDDDVIELLARSRDEGTLWSVEHAADGSWADPRILATLPASTKLWASACPGVGAFVEDGVLVAFDFDGIPEPVELPAGARMRASGLFGYEDGGVAIASPCLAPLTGELEPRVPPTSPIATACVDGTLHLAIGVAAELFVYEVDADVDPC